MNKGRYSKNPHKRTTIFLESGWQRFLNYGHLKGHLAQTYVGIGVMWSNYGQKSLLAAVQSGKGHICFTKPFLLNMGCKISDWKFLKFWFFHVGFYCILSHSLSNQPAYLKWMESISDQWNHISESKLTS